MADDCRGFALVREFELECGLNHLAEVPKLKVIVRDALDYDAVSSLAIREKDCDCYIAIRAAVARNESQSLFTKAVLKLTQGIGGPKNHFLATMDSIGKFAPVKLTHAIVGMLGVKIVIATHVKAHVAPFLGRRTWRIFHRLVGGNVVIPNV